MINLELTQVSDFVKTIYEVNQTLKKINKNKPYLISKLNIYALGELNLVQAKIKTSSLEEVFNHIKSGINGIEFFAFHKENKNEITGIVINNDGTFTINATKNSFTSMKLDEYLKNTFKKYKDVITEIKNNKLVSKFNKYDHEILEISETKVPVLFNNKKLSFRFPPSFIYIKPDKPIKNIPLIDFVNTKKQKALKKQLKDLNIDYDINNMQNFSLIRDDIEINVDSSVNIKFIKQNQSIKVYSSNFEKIFICLWTQSNKYIDLKLIFKFISS